jgi:hypothetical protein
MPIYERKYWNSFFDDVSAMASQDQVNAFHIETDMFKSLNTELLEKQYRLWWYTQVGTRLGFPGLCAPVTTSRCASTLLRASSYTKNFKDSSGYKIDCAQSWTNVHVIQDGYDQTRQEKLIYLCKDSNRHYLSHLRVCNETTNPHKINCGRCEKCIRNYCRTIDSRY